MLRRALIAREARARSQAPAAASRDGAAAAPPFKRPRLSSSWGLPKHLPHENGLVGLDVSEAS
eukprot:4853513-Pyramimonas_sp.AAC.1